MDTSDTTSPLQKLLADLLHFEETSDFGENSTVIEIKNHLLRRIADLESAMRRTRELESESSPATPDGN
jgi:hypothetical protein